MPKRSFLDKVYVRHHGYGTNKDQIEYFSEIKKKPKQGKAKRVIYYDDYDPDLEKGGSEHIDFAESKKLRNKIKQKERRDQRYKSKQLKRSKQVRKKRSQNKNQKLKISKNLIYKKKQQQLNKDIDYLLQGSLLPNDLNL